MNAPIKWEDEYYVSKERIVLTNKQLEIPGLDVFARHNMPCAIDPLTLHFHENAFEFIFITEGVFSFQASGEDYRVNGGDIFVSFPNEIHSTNQIPLSLGEIFWFQLNISSVQNLLFLSNSAASHLIEQLNTIKNHVNKPHYPKEMRLLLKKAFALTKDPGSKYLISSYLVLFLNLLIDNSQESSSSLTSDIEKAIDYVLENFKQDISLETLADHCHLSISQFKQKFKTQMGISPRCFINLQKIEYAKTLLLEGKSKTDIAMLAGFNSSSYFSAVFKKYTSFTPSEYVASKGEDI